MQNNAAERSAPAYRVNAVDHALRLLELFRSRPHVCVSEVATQLGVARSTAHRLLGMFIYRGFATQDGATRLYRPGPLLIDVGLAALANLDVRRKAQPFLIQLRDQTGETVSLQIMEGRTVRFVDSIESLNAVRVGARVGVSMSAHASSGGKLLLADLSPQVFEDLYPDEILEPVNANTITSRAALARELEEVRRLGYALNREESQPGLGAVGMAVRDPQGRSLAAITIAAPMQRMTDENIERFVRSLRGAVAELGQSLYH